MDDVESGSEWGDREWTGLLWVRGLAATPNDWRGIVGYDGYRRSYFAALYLLDDEDQDSSLVWAVGNQVGDEVRDLHSFVDMCEDWQEFWYSGAVNWGEEPGLRQALARAPVEAQRRHPLQKWYRHFLNETEIWSRMFELDELEPDWVDDERQQYKRGYVLGRHFSSRSGLEGELGHVLRAHLTEWQAVPEYQAMEALDRMGIPPEAASPPE